MLRQATQNLITAQKMNKKSRNSIYSISKSWSNRKDCKNHKDNANAVFCIDSEVNLS